MRLNMRGAEDIVIKPTINHVLPMIIAHKIWIPVVIAVAVLAGGIVLVQI